MVKKKIILISSGLRIGGVERSLIGLLNTFDYSRYDVSLFLYAHDGEFMGMVPSQVHLLAELPAYAAIQKPIVSILFSEQFPIAVARLFAKLVTAFCSRCLGIKGLLLPRSIRYCQPFLSSIPGQYDLAISFLAPHDPILNKVAARCRIGWVHTDYKAIECDVDSSFEWPTWRGLDTIVAVSDEVRESFLKVYPELCSKTVVVKNILSPKDVVREAEAFSVSEEMPVVSGETRICSVGRFCFAKNFDSIPGAVRKLNDIGIRVRWYLIGYGADEVLIRRKILALNVRDQVIILGKKVNPYPYIKACDIYVQPSRYEGEAVTIREARILGKPIVATDFPTARGQIINGFDGVITPMSVDGIAIGIQKLIEEPEIRKRLVGAAANRDDSNREEVEKIIRMIRD